MSSFSTMNFSAGLKEFGKLDWDVEFEELTSSEPMIESSSKDEFHLQDNGESTYKSTDLDISAKPDNASFLALDNTIIISGPVIAKSPRPQFTDNNIASEQHNSGLVVVTTPRPQAATYAPSDEHHHIIQEQQLHQKPTHSNNHATSQASDIQQSTTLQRPTSQPIIAESPSWYPHITATTPQVSLWSGSPHIFGDIKGTLDAWFYNRTVEHGIPRRASILIRAIQHLYPVPHEAGITYPLGPTGRKGQRLSDRRSKERFHRGPSPLSEALLVDCIQGGNEQVLLLESEEVMGAEMVEEEEMVEDAEELAEEELQEIKNNLEEWLEEDSDGEAELHLSFEERIEAQFEREIDGGSLPTHIVDEDTALFYADDEPLQDTVEDEDSSSCDGFDDASSGPFATSRVTSPESSCGSDSEDLLDEVKRDLVLYVEDIKFGIAHDNWTSQFDNDDIDEALARLEQMSIVSTEELEGRRMDGDFENLLAAVGGEDNEGQGGEVLLDTVLMDDVAVGVAGVDKQLSPICTLFGLADLLEVYIDAVLATEGSQTSPREAKIEALVSASISAEVSSVVGEEVLQERSGGVGGILSGISNIAKGFWAILRDGPVVID